MKLSSFTALSALFALASLSLVQGTLNERRQVQTISLAEKNRRQADQEQTLLIIEGGRLFTVTGAKERIYETEALLVEIDRAKQAANGTEEDKAVLRAAFKNLKNRIADLVNMKRSQAADETVGMSDFDYRSLAHLLIYQDGYLAPEDIGFLVNATEGSNVNHSFFYSLYDEMKKQLAVLKEADRVVSGDDFAPSIFTVIFVDLVIFAAAALSVFVIVREWASRYLNVHVRDGYSGEKNLRKN